MAGTEAGPPCGAPGANEENGMTTVTDSFDADARITPAASSAFAPTAIDAATAAKANLQL